LHKSVFTDRQYISRGFVLEHPVLLVQVKHHSYWILTAQNARHRPKMVQCGKIHIKNCYYTISESG